MPGEHSHAAFLRGMNVGGHRLRNAELKRHCETIGLREVATFRASGNVVFAVDAHDTDEVCGLIEAGLESALGYAVPSFIRSGEQVRAIAALQPFPAAALAASIGKLQVLLLSSAPAAATRRAVLALTTDQDLLSFGKRELYWLPSGGTLESSVDLKAIDRLLGALTMRTKGTIELIAGKYFAG